MQSASLKEAELACRHLELEVKESSKRAARAEAERDAACHEATMGKLEIEGVVNMLRPNDIYKFKALLPEDYCLIPGNGAIKLVGS